MTSLNHTANISERWHFPLKIQIQTQSLCNYACSMCPYPQVADGRAKAVMPLTMFDSILNELDRRERVIDLCLMLQNEPLLDKRFEAIAARAHAHPRIRSVATVTNGSALTLDKLDRLLALSRLQLTISVNAVTRKRYLEVHGRDRWQAVHTLLSTWNGDRSRVLLSCVVGDGRAAEAAEFAEYWQEQGYPVRLLLQNRRSGALAEQSGEYVPSSEFGHCRYPLDTLTVLADGTVLLCCQDWKHERTFGNLNEASIHDIWNQPALTAIREAAVRGELQSLDQCRGCDYPMRSVDRLRLENEVLGRAPMPARSSEPTVPHVAKLRSATGEVNVLVHSIRSDGTILALAAEPAAVGPGSFEIPLDYNGGGTSGAFECGAYIEPVKVRGGQSAHDWHGYRIRLSAHDPAARLLPWYACDWNARGD